MPTSYAQSYTYVDMYFFPHLVVPPVVKIKSPNPALLPENIDRLAYPPYRPVPKRSHAQKCDARYVSSY